MAMRTTATAASGGYGITLWHGGEAWVLTWAEAQALFADMGKLMAKQAAARAAARSAAAYGDGGYALSMGEWAEAKGGN